MRGLRTRFERFCYNNRHKGIPNLMLYFVLGCGLVTISRYVPGLSGLAEWLCFDKTMILQGQVWRLVTFLFTYSSGLNIFMALISLYFFYSLGRAVELTMGTFRFNLYMLCSWLFMVGFAMIFSPAESVVVDGHLMIPYDAYIYTNMAMYIHTTLLLTFASCHPDTDFIVFYFIPVKAWFLSIVYLLITGLEIMTSPSAFPHSWFPLVGIASFLLFAGKDVLNLLPPAWRPNHRRAAMRREAKGKPPKVAKPIPMRTKDTKNPKSVPYTNRCTICGRTDVSDPQLEFRYCSRCTGYHCYCEEHIKDHPHINE